MIEETLQNLKSHSKCKSVCFVDGANAFNVVNNDNCGKRFKVKGRNKNKSKALKYLEIDSWAALRDCFSAAGEEALEFLNGPPGMASASAPMEEPPVPDVCPFGPMENP